MVKKRALHLVFYPLNTVKEVLTNMTKKVMRLLDQHTGLMECKICGATHWANIKPYSGGKYYRGSWQCQNGCKIE